MSVAAGTGYVTVHIHRELSMSLVGENHQADESALGTPSFPFCIRPATAGDGKGVAALFVQCVGGALEEHRQGFEREMASGRAGNLVLIAEAEGTIIGFARARHVGPACSSSTNAAPPGWYLLGVDVLPEHRRTGVGAELTRARLEWIAERAEEAFYFTEAENRGSIALHERFGFREVSRGVEYPDALGAAGSRVLYRVELSTLAADRLRRALRQGA